MWSASWLFMERRKESNFVLPDTTVSAGLAAARLAASDLRRAAAAYADAILL